MSGVVCFFSVYFVLLLLSFQSIAVNRGEFLSAFLAASGAGVCNALIMKFVPDANGIDLALYVAGAPLGVISGMWLHRHWRLRRGDKQ